MKRLLFAIAILLSAVSLYAQENEYTVNISGAPCIILDYMYRPGENSDHSFDYENNLGTYYADNDGVIRISLPKGHYQYIVPWKQSKPQNGSFYITSRNVYFEIRYFPPYLGIDIKKATDLGYQYLGENKKKEAREYFLAAAESGSVDGMYAYAHMCRNGIGGRRDKNHAYHWMNEALKHGHPYADLKLEHFNDKYQWRFP